MNYIVNVNKIYINDTAYAQAKDIVNSLITAESFTLTLAPESGAFADIADFAGDINTTFTAMSKAVTVRTLTAVNPSYLSILSAAIGTLEAAGGEVVGSSVDMTSTYGYALDMAFRCNANGVTKLLLQTTPEQRVSDESNSASTLGGGSFMEFSTRGEGIDITKRIELMDAIRVAFVDDQNNLLGVAKLNTSNKEITDGKIKAPLYLYGYSFDEDGAMIMDERRKTDNIIASLDKNVAKAITAIVWLDGDLVDNTMVAADQESSLDGVLNLQFASDANLIPADNAELLNLTPDKASLQQVVEASKLFYNAGNNLEYTSASWDEYVYAHNCAVAVYNDLLANESQILAAQTNLVLAQKALVPLTHDALNAKIEEIRELMGETSDLARYVVVGGDGNYAAVDPYTNEQALNKVGEIYRVDYAKNLQDEGNDIKTPIYSDASWTALAATLYDAEAVNMDPNASEARLDSAISALEVAYDALDRRVYFTPYDYEGSIYYLAISDETDTYGKWYDSTFKRIVSDLRILELDTGAKPADIAEIDMPEYIKNIDAYIEETDNAGNYYLRLNPEIKMFTTLYTELAGEEIIAIGWKSSSNDFVFSVSQAQLSKLDALAKRADALGIATEDVAAAEQILAGNTVTDTDVDGIDALIGKLETAIKAEEDRLDKEAADAVTSMSADYRVLLNAAIEAATTSDQYNEKAVDGEGKETGEFKYAALREKTAAAQAFLAKNDPQQAEAETVLDALNTELKAAGLREYTYDNYIQHSIPVGSEVYEVVYGVDSPTGVLYFTTDNKKVDSTEITAFVLTKNGVVLNLAKTIEIYSPADKAEIKEPVSGTTIKVGDSVEFAADLVSFDTAVNVAHTEDISSYLWSSTDSDVLRVSDAAAEAGKFTALAKGTATIRVTLTTEQGNSYTAKLVINVVE